MALQQAPISITEKSKIILQRVVIDLLPIFPDKGSHQ